MKDDVVLHVERYFASRWEEPVRCVALGKVTQRARRGRKFRENVGDDSHPVGCLVNMVLEVFATLLWPFAALWGSVRYFRKKTVRNHKFVVTGPAKGQAYQVAELLRRSDGRIVIARTRRRLAIAQITGQHQPKIIWLAQEDKRPKWSPKPVSLYWSDGSAILFTS